MEASVERWLLEHSELFAALVVTLGFLLRLREASGTFLNPDEALHFLLSNQTSLRLAYQASLTSSHPPLLIFVLYFLRRLGTAEWILRLPSVLAATGTCWLFYRWVKTVRGPVVALCGLLLIAFLPPIISLSAEVRQYSLMLFFLSGAAYLLELALVRDSALLALASALCLCFGLASHYSAIFFMAASAGYVVLCIIMRRTSLRFVAGWAGGQAVALALAGFFYFSHLSQLSSSPTDKALNGWMRNSYLHNYYFNPGDNVAHFIFARSFGFFQFLVGHRALGDVIGVVFIAGLVFALKERSLPSARRTATPLQLIVLLTLPFAIGCAAAIADKYPYGGTRHCAYLVMFGIIGVCIPLFRIARNYATRALAVILAIVLFTTARGFPSAPHMQRRDQRLGQMQAGINFLYQHVSPGDAILVDYESTLELGHYLCHAPPVYVDYPASRLAAVPCGQFRVISTTPDVWLFDRNNFLTKWNAWISNPEIAPKARVWVVQAGWGIVTHLPAEIQDSVPGADLEAQPFGSNIQIFSIDATRTSSH
ncbi:MAG: glycosyltransferase family 39 protein [Acidobacteriales bacterium]|nr:glycosyltransferase family 39 protein [Terriglobales bacterium]